MPFNANEIINPRKTAYRREEAAEGHTAVPPSAAWKAQETKEGHGVPFTKQWTAAERAEHQRALARALRGR